MNNFIFFVSGPFIADYIGIGFYSLLKTVRLTIIATSTSFELRVTVNYTASPYFISNLYIEIFKILSRSDTYMYL